MEEIRYPHIERVWEQRYNLNNKIEKEPKTVYTEILDNNKGHEDEVALRYFLSKISFGRMFEMELATSKALNEYHVKRGDNVACVIAGIPEMIYTFYSCAQFGATSVLISPFADKDELARRIDKVDAKIILVMDTFYPMVKDAIARTNIKNIIIVPTFNSSILKPFMPKLKLDKHGKETPWNEFIKDGAKAPVPPTVPYEKDAPLTCVYSSGTTGNPKGIVLSNDSLLHTARAYPEMGVNVSRGQTFYQVIPPWASTGISICINLPLTYGCSVFMDPRFKTDVFVKNIIKVKPDYSLGTTSMYEGFLDPHIQKKHFDLSNLNYPFEGGEPLKKEVCNKITKVFKAHNCSSELRVGYGQCECGATITTQIHGIENGEGSVGIPLPGINIAISDENRKFLGYNQRGEILVDTPSSMIEYHKNPEATAKYFYYDEEGTRWNCTGDIGYIKENGELYILGRASDFTTVNGEKIYNFDIENAIISFPEVKDVDVLGVNTEDGQKLVAHIILTTEYAEACAMGSKNVDDLLEAIREKLEAEYPENYMVSAFKIRDTFPCAPSGKRDVEAMKKETEGIIIKTGSTRTRK